MPVLFESECGPKCRSKRHSLEVNSVVTRGSLQEVQAYSRLCQTWPQRTDTMGRSALHVAASCGKTQVVDWLIAEKNQDPSLKDKESGWTSLHRALFYGQLASARLLIQYNSDLYCRDHEGLGPLDVLVKDQPKHLNFALKDANEVYSWGDNSNLTIGHTSEQHRTIPEVVDAFRRLTVSVKQIVMCKYHTAFLAQGGLVYTCGHGQGGRLGHGDEQTCVVPRCVDALQKEECVQIAAARDHTLFLTEKNTVYCCGLNDCHQLGLTATAEKGAVNKCLLPTKMNLKLLKGKVILGVCAGRFHSLVYCADGIYTCGLNAGQIGQPKGERLQSQLRQVSFLHHKDTTIVHVATSDAAIVCYTSRGDIYLFHEYTCKKIGSRWLDIEKLQVCGGNLDHNSDLDVLREKGGFEVKVVMLSNSGKVYMYRSGSVGGSVNLKRCQFMMRRQVLVKDVAVSMTGVLLVTDKGEAFTGYLSGKRPTPLHKENNKESNKESEFGKVSLMDLMLKDEVEEVSLRRVPVVHRACAVVCDVKGRNFAVLQALPNAWLTDVPCVMESTIESEYQQLMDEADMYDAIHDCVVQVGDQQWPGHLFILASRADYFRKQVPVLASEQGSGSENPVIEVTDVEPEVMEQLLKFIYTDSCDLVTLGKKVTLGNKVTSSNKVTLDNSGAKSVFSNKESDVGQPLLFNGKAVSAFEVEQNRKKGGKIQKEEKKAEKGARSNEKDPVKILQEAARRFGVKGLSKRLEAVKCVNGVIQSRGKKLQPPHIRYDRAKLGELYDVCIQANDNTTIQCHKCVLAARLEYFHSMLGSGWIETSDTQSLTLPVPGDILEILLDFVYQDDSAIVAETQDVELLCNILVVADQFLVERLKEMCEVALTSLLTLRNVGELLEIATAYNATQLCRACQQFITLNLPALLESRNLDLLSDDTMDNLTEYYKSIIERMSCRVITPWSDGPDSEFLAALTSEFDADANHNKARGDSVSKKSKAKRRQSRTKSSSEDTTVTEENLNTPALMTERQVSVSSDISTKSEEDSMEIKESAASLTAKTDAFETTPMDIQGSAGPDDGSVSIPAPLSPGRSPGLSLRNIMQEQQSTMQSVKPKSSSRISWKEVKKQQNRAAQVQRKGQSEAGHAQPTSPSASPVSAPACPWGSVNKVVKSFRDLMLEDKNSQPAQPQTKHVSTPAAPRRDKASADAVALTPSQLPSAAQVVKSPPATVVKSPSQSGTSFSWGLPLRIPSQPQSIPTPPTPTFDRPSPSSPPDNPWQRCVPASSPPEGAAASPVAMATGGGGVCFSAIVQDQLHQKHSLEKASQKPLHLIQMEEEAISQLLEHYHAGQRSDEYITVERVSGPMAAPLWDRKRTSFASHP